MAAEASQAAEAGDKEATLARMGEREMFILTAQRAQQAATAAGRRVHRLEGQAQVASEPRTPT